MTINNKYMVMFLLINNSSSSKINNVIKIDMEDKIIDKFINIVFFVLHK